MKEFLSYFDSIIKETDFIIGYNVHFDINVILSELYRYRFNDSISKIMKLKKKQQILCAGILASGFVRPDR